MYLLKYLQERLDLKDLQITMKYDLRLTDQMSGKGIEALKKL